MDTINAINLALDALNKAKAELINKPLSTGKTINIFKRKKPKPRLKICKNYYVQAETNTPDLIVHVIPKYDEPKEILTYVKEEKLNIFQDMEGLN